MSNQELLVGYGTALDYWRTARVAAGLGVEPLVDDGGKVFGARQMRLGELAQLALVLCNSEAPLDVAVSSSSGRHCCELIDSHVWKGPLPADQRHGLGSGIEVCRIPIVFSQLAITTEPIELCRIGYEITGTYGLTPWANEAYANRLVPLATVQELMAYAQTARALKVRGATRACDALKRVTDGSKSPRESDVAIIMALTRKSGGFGLCGFVMNQAIELSPRAQEILGYHRIAPDFFWPGTRTVMEYDSDEWHLDPISHARDSRRREALSEDGYSVHVLTNEQVKDFEHLQVFMGRISRELHRNREKSTPLMEMRLRDVYDALFGSF